MTLSQAKGLFIWGTVISAVIFLGLTYDSISEIPARTHEEKLSDAVAAGKWTWQRHNCNDCHTILGIGGYYAPDLTKVMTRRDPEWLKDFLKDPHKVWPAKRRMPNLHLTDEEIGDLVAFLTWVNGIDTNDWPPKPLAVAVAGTATAPGESVFRAQGCSACHKLNGVGGDIGPDLTHVGSRRTAEWIRRQLENPKSHFPNSPMPSFTKLSPKDMQALVDFLYGLK
jgi:nitric oxide reductase subunit C